MTSVGKILRGASICAIALGTAAPAQAATCNWLATVGNWMDTGNWSCGAVPTAADTVSVGRFINGERVPATVNLTGITANSGRLQSTVNGDSSLDILNLRNSTLNMFNVSFQGRIDLSNSNINLINTPIPNVPYYHIVGSSTYISNNSQISGVGQHIEAVGEFVLDDSAGYARIGVGGGTFDLGALGGGFGDAAILGSGSFGDNGTLIRSDGRIIANVAGRTLTIDAAGGPTGWINGEAGFDNFGAVSAVGGGSVLLAEGRYRNAQTASFSARGPGSVFTMANGAVLTNFLGGQLANGRYDSETTAAGEVSVLNLRGSSPDPRSNSITTIGGGGSSNFSNTFVRLMGANSQLNVLDYASGAARSIDESLRRVDSTGHLTIGDGRVLTITANGGEFNNRGQVVLSDGTINAANFLNENGLSGFGRVNSDISQGANGSVRAVGGTLSTGAILGSHQIIVSTNSTLDMSAATRNSSAGGLSMGTNGMLNLGSQNMTITTATNAFGTSFGDYNNDFGAGNAFDPRRGILGTGQILSSSATMDLSGPGLTGNIFNIGNIRIGDTRTLSITNNGTATNLRGVVNNAQAGSVSLTGPNAAGWLATARGGRQSVGITGSIAGSLAGQSLFVVNNFDNVADQTLNLVGNIFAPAIADLSTRAVNFGIVRGGSVATRDITVTNRATGALTDALVSSASDLPGGVSAALPGNLGGGQSGTASFTLDTARGGTVSGTGALNFVSSNGLMADLALASQSVTFSGTVTELANAVLFQNGGAGTLSGSGNSYTLNLGSLSANSGSFVSDLGVANSIVASLFSEALGGAFAHLGDAGFSFAGSPFNLLAGGQSGIGNLLSFDTTGLSAGSYTSLLTFNGFSRFAGLDDYVLGPITLNITATIRSGGTGGMGAVPEPATWAMMIAGFGLVGGAMRTRARKLAFG